MNNTNDKQTLQNENREDILADRFGNHEEQAAAADKAAEAEDGYGPFKALHHFYTDQNGRIWRSREEAALDYFGEDPEPLKTSEDEAAEFAEAASSGRAINRGPAYKEDEREELLVFEGEEWDRSGRSFQILALEGKFYLLMKSRWSCHDEGDDWQFDDLGWVPAANATEAIAFANEVTKKMEELSNLEAWKEWEQCANMEFSSPSYRRGL